MIKNAPQAENLASEILYPNDRNKNIFPAYTVETRLCFGEMLMSYDGQNKKSARCGQEKWRRQCYCLRRSFREVCYRICRLSDCLNGRSRY